MEATMIDYEPADGMVANFTQRTMGKMGHGEVEIGGVMKMMPASGILQSWFSRYGLEVLDSR